MQILPLRIIEIAFMANISVHITYDVLSMAVIAEDFIIIDARSGIIFVDQELFYDNPRLQPIVRPLAAKRILFNRMGLKCQLFFYLIEIQARLIITYNHIQSAAAMSGFNNKLIRKFIPFYFIQCVESSN